jgi:TPR repeat protein
LRRRRWVAAALISVCAVAPRAGAQNDFDQCLNANVQALGQQAAQGDVTAEYCVGFFYATGRSGYAKNVAEGVRHFRRAGDKGYAPAQAFMGYFYKHGEGVTQDYREAARWYRMAAEKGHAGAQNDLALLYLDGSGVPKDKNEAIKWLRLSAQQGNGQAQNVLAALERGGPATARQEPATDRFDQGKRLYMAGNKAAAVQPFMESAQAGNSQAQVQIGYQYEFGEGLPQNNAEAARWYGRAAELGNALGACNLGTMYENGTGVPEDWVAATRWYKMAADQHNRRCEASMGRSYQFGVGVPQNRAEAIAWFERAGTGTGYDPQAAYWAKWLRDFTNNIGFRNQAEHDLVIGGKLRFAIGSGDASGLLFHNSAERNRWLMGQRREVDLREAHTFWQINKTQYDACQRNGGSNCVNPGAEPRP